MKSEINGKYVYRMGVMSQALFLVVAVVGLLGVLGWINSNVAFQSILPGLPVIAPNTTVAFFLLGLVLLILSFKPKQSIGSKISFPIFLLVFIIGFLTLVEYVSGLSLGVDQVFFNEAYNSVGQIVRMSPQSAISFIILSLALLVLDQQTSKGNWPSQAIVLIVGIIALISIFGFIYNVPALYTISEFKGMAIQTAFSFAMLFIGILALNPERGFMQVFIKKGVGGIVARRIFGSLLILLLVDVIIMTGQRLNFYEPVFESIFHLMLVITVFLYLVFAAFGSLDKISEMETEIKHFKEIDKAKTEFVNLASHQLRTPLTSISWYAEMLMHGDVGQLSEKQNNYLREIYIGNRRMIDLVDDLLNSSRVDMGSLALDHKAFDLRLLIQGVLDEMRSEIERKKIKLITDHESDLPLMEGDPDYTRIVVQNLLSNAIKYTPERGKINLKLSRLNRRFLLEVSDTGYGIPKNQQAKIFTKLFRADNVRTKETNGTGLGLYIVKGILKQLGGKIWFSSQEGRGTQFFVSIPVK